MKIFIFRKSGKNDTDRNCFPARRDSYMKQDKAEEKIRQDTEQYDVCACCRHKSTPRDAAKQKKLTSRINRIIGQLSGIQNMLDDNRYCGDILIQIGAVESAPQGLGYLILEEHMETCVVEQIRQGNTAIMAEAVELMKKLK